MTCFVTGRGGEGGGGGGRGPRKINTREFFIFLKIQDGRRRSKISMNCFAAAAAGEGKITFLLGIWIPFIGSRQNLAWTYYLILGDPRIFLKIQDGRRRSKVENRPNFTSQITFRLVIWIWFIQFGPNLAGRYYLTQGTSLRKHF